MKIKEFQGEYRWLSNFWKCDVTYMGIRYPSTEHAYQATKYPEDQKKQFSVEGKLNAAEAKKLGLKGPILLPEAERLQLMLELNRLKFSKDQNPELFDKLKSLPADTVFEEGNYWGDKFWGVCLKTNVGENHLGKIIKQVHTEVLSQ